MVGLKPGSQPAGGELVIAKSGPPTALVKGERFGQRLVRQAIGKARGVGEGEIHALPELGAHGMCRVAEDNDALAIPTPHSDIAITGREHLVPRGDLREKAGGFGTKCEDLCFPLGKRAGSPAGVG